MVQDAVDGVIFESKNNVNFPVLIVRFSYTINLPTTAEKMLYIPKNSVTIFVDPFNVMLDWVATDFELRAKDCQILSLVSVIRASTVVYVEEKSNEKGGRRYEPW